MPSLPADVPARPPASGRPFVGRQAELEILRQLLGKGRLVLVTGEPGIGKTRLAEEFAAEAEGRHAAVRWGRSWEGEGAPAFWPWIQILRQEEPGLEAHAGSEIVRLLRDVGTPLDDTSEASPLAPGPSRFQLFDEVTTALTRIAAARPLVLALEDLHWADRPSLRLLQFVVRHARNVPLLMIATYRNAEVDKTHPLASDLGALLRHAEPMPLAGLDAGAVERYVAATLGDTQARTLGPRLYRDTEGHPLFLVELVRLLESGNATPGLPDGIRDLIARRLAHHSQACREILEVAAVIGRDFRLSLLRRIQALAGSDLLTVLDEALAGRLVLAASSDGETFRFSHALVREALYADLPLGRRIELHREVGEALEAGGADDQELHIAELAHHFGEASADGDGGRAIHYALRAGERATRMLAHEEAVVHSERGLRLLERHDADESHQCPVLMSLGLAQVRAGDPAGAEATFARLATLARRLGRAEELSRAALGLGELERSNERLIPLLEEALAALDPADSVLRSRLLSRLSVALYWTQAEGRKRALSDEAVAMARRLGYVPTLAFALSSRIAALSGPDDIEARLAAATEMVMLAEQCAHRELAMIGRGWIIGDALALGDIHRVRFGIETFDALATASRHPYYQWWLSAFRTMLANLEGRLADAETLAQETFKVGQRAVVVDAAQVFAAHLYGLSLEGERHEQLEMLVRGIIDQFPAVPGGRCLLAMLHADRGRVAEATAELDALAPDRFAALPRNPDWLSCIAVLAQTSALLPDAPHAATLYELLAPYRGRVIVSAMGVLCSGVVDHFLGILASRLGRFEAAARHLDDARVGFERIGAPAWRAYAQYERSALALVRGDRALAATAAADARAFAESHGMRRLQRLLGTLAVGPPAATDRSRPQRDGILRRDGDFWNVGWEASAFRLRDRLGLHYLAALIAAPSREILATDLVRLAGGRGKEPDLVRVPAREDAGPPRELVSAETTLDRQAEAAYRRRLEELRTVIDEARRHNDLGRLTAAESESDALMREIARGLGIHARGRESRSPIERARVSVTRAIRVAMRLIQQHDPGFGRHLAVTIKTGTYCAYVPDPELTVRWIY